MEEIDCWACGGEPIVYTDVLKLGWCRDCFESLYLAEVRREAQ